MSMQRYHLDIMADVFYQVRFPIVGIEWWVRKSAWHWGRSMSSENGDQAALCKARLIASMVALRGRRSFGEFEPQSAYSHERE